MSERLNKEDIKQDPFADFVEQTSSWVRGHGRQLFWGAVGVVALFLSLVGFSSWRDRQAVQAGEALEAALEVLSAPIDASDPAPDAKSPTFADEAARTERAKALLQAVRDDHRGSEAAAQAAVHLGEIALDESRLDDARALLQSYLDEHGDGLLAGAVQLSIWRLDRQQGDSEAVVERVRSEIAQGDSVLPEDVLLFELGTVLEEVGRGVEAREPYTRIGDDHPDSPYAAAAQERLALLPEAPETPAEPPAEPAS